MDGRNPAGAVAVGNARTPAPIVVPDTSAAAPTTDPGACNACDILFPLASSFF